MKIINILPLGLICLLTACSKSDSNNKTATVWTCNTPLQYKDSIQILTLPTAFTPNGDGKNDLYRPIAQNLTNNNFLITIYKPDGKIIYQLNNYTSGWDGRDSSGTLGTDSKYGISITFTNAHGHIVDTCSELFLLTTNTATGCTNRTVDSSSYIFEDQIDMATGAPVYRTNEVFCN